MRERSFVLWGILFLGATVAAIFAAAATNASTARRGSGEQARNVIFMVPDGMGMADVTLLRVALGGPGGALLQMERPEYVGYQRTHSRDSLVTDSAAAGSAWACGEKFPNGAICQQPDGRRPRSLMDHARALGKATGLVVTSSVTHATPAAFAAHSPDRDCEVCIAREYMTRSRPDVILGSGLDAFVADEPDPCGCEGDSLALAREAGYRIVTDRAGLDKARAARETPILGLFGREGMVPEWQRPDDCPEPRLPEMTATALELLSAREDGFFLLVEGSQIDWAKHEGALDYLLGELRAFDEAVGVVLDWIAAEPRRREETLLVIVSDHECGGLSLSGPPGEHPPATKRFHAAFATDGHTGVDTIVWSQGPGAQRLARPLDNTDIHRVVLEAMGGR